MTLEVAQQLQNTHDALRGALESGDADSALNFLEGVQRESLRETGKNYVKGLEINETVWKNQQECCNFISSAFSRVDSLKKNPLPELVLLEA